MSNLWKKLSKRARIISLITVGAVIAALVFGFVYMSGVQKYKNDIAALQVREVDLSAVEDGEYFGDCDVGFVRASVRVVVLNNLITEIELLEHFNGRGETAEALPAIMIREQRIDVDAVSGATSSSKVIKEAVYNALTGA